MSLAAIIPAADAPSANSALNSAGHGPNNFSVPVYSGGDVPSHAGLHTGGDVAFEALVKGISGVVTSEIEGDPKDRFRDCLTQASAEWGYDFPELAGQVTPGYYEHDGQTWLVIQSFDRDVFTLPLENYPALVTRVRTPGEVLPWVQPNSTNPYKLVNSFTGQPDRVTHNGQTWEVTQADGAGNNIWEPGVFGWSVV